jgi:hypothetical protein
MKDMYYFGESNLKKQAYATTVNTRFVQNFTNLGAGSSQFVISPQGGVSDIILQFTTAAGTYTGLSLNQGWGYALINRVSVRYGSSAQYFFSGTQVFLQNLIDSEVNEKVLQVGALGGAAATGSAIPGKSAYVYLKLPHNSIRADGKPLPFPSDLLVQPIVVTVELLAANSILIAQTGTLANAPSALAVAQMQVKQEMLTDSSDLLARRVDMNSHAYTFPLMYFCQQEVQVPIPTGSYAQSVNLTGFRAGEVKSIVLWLTPSSATFNENTPGSGGYNPLLWPQMSQIVLTYNGEVFSRFDTASAALWNLASDQKSSTYTGNYYVTNGTAGQVAAQTDSVSYWQDCPFAQVALPYDRCAELCHGKPILNAVVNLTFNTPTNNTPYILHAMYLYNASLLCSRGSAEYIF